MPHFMTAAPSQGGLSDSERACLKNYFNLTCELIENGRFYKYSSPRFVIPVRQFSIGPQDQLQDDEDILVEIFIDPALLALKSQKELYLRLDNLKNMLDAREMPRGLEHRVVKRSELERFYVRKCIETPYSYVHKDSLDPAKHILCIESSQDYERWPGPGFSVDLKKGDALFISRSELDHLQALLSDTKDSLRHARSTPEAIIRQNLFQLGFPLSTRAKTRVLPAEDFVHYQPA